MSLNARRTGWVYVTALSWRVLAHRFSFLVFLLFSVGILFAGHMQPRMVEQVRVKVVDGVAPVLDLLSRPLVLVNQVVTRVQTYRALVEENDRLKAENTDLRQWQNTAFALQNENRELRKLLRYKTEPSLSYVSARVIADTGGAFARSLIVTAGKVDGVREGMAAMTGDGLVGRIVEAGEWTSRVMMINDINSRIPVVLTGAGDHAILSGDNSSVPKLLYLPQDADVKEGMRVMTSGHGGIFPPNVPVGVIAGVHHGEVEVAPFASLGRISQVRLIDFNLAAGAVNPMAEKIVKTPN